eukprot:jgi/Psemu1/40957/gm1.40957_g
MNAQFQSCIQYKRTFNATEDHDSHKLVVDYARATNRSAGKKNLRRVQNFEVKEILYTYDIFCLSQGPRKRWNETMANRKIDHSREGFKAAMKNDSSIPTPTHVKAHGRF